MCGTGVGVCKAACCGAARGVDARLAHARSVSAHACLFGVVTCCAGAKLIRCICIARFEFCIAGEP
jgi:hypothetical protein